MATVFSFSDESDRNSVCNASRSYFRPQNGLISAPDNSHLVNTHRYQL